ncbi:MAG: tetratricopeptide repeat protein [Campylobacterota bacterium]
MRTLVLSLLLCCITLSLSYANEDQNTQQRLDEKTQEKIEDLEEPLYNPFIERYMIDEIKDLRVQQQNLRAQMTEKIANSKLEVSDRAMTYVTNTVNNIFFMLTAIGSLVALLGWKSVKDIRQQTKVIVQQRVEKIVENYEKKLKAVEDEMQTRSRQIIENQERINRSNQIHSLWRRSQLEDNIQAKVDIYDQILALDPNNVEALTYKADAVLDLGEKEWALNLSNQALEIDDSYAYSFWQRACVNAELQNVENAISDISAAVTLSPSLLNDIETEKSFDYIREDERFVKFVNEIPES